LAPAPHQGSFTSLGLETIEVEFGLSLDAEAGTFVAKTGASGHSTIKLNWSRPQEEA
jgi:hypothetical protein